jgi:DNA-binding FrmR family transcriptional regulator
VQTHRIPQDARTAVIHRLRRAEGQLRAVSRALEEGGDCVAVLRQLAAAKNAVEHAGVKLLSAGLIECLARADEDDLTPEQFEKLFTELA